MTRQEVIHLVGDFRPDVLERWKQFAELTNRTVRHTTYAELPKLERDNPVIIFDDHGLNDLVF